MKKTAMLMTSMLVLGSLVAPVAAHAAENPTAANSTGKITLTAGGDNSTDPEDPNGGDDHGTGNKGPLTIDQVPDLDFGKAEVSAAGTKIKNTTEKANTQVTDNRGTGAGWALKVSSSEFKSGDNVLAGASINLPAGDVNSKASISDKPTTSAATVVADGASDASLVMNAAKNAGMGTWVDALKSDDITLNFAPGNLAGDYTATLSWSLEDAPQA